MSQGEILPAIPAPGGGQDPWEKRRSETVKSYNAFAIYRDLGSNGSLPKVAAILAATMPDRKEATILAQLKAWSAQHDWVERRDLYFLEFERRMREASEAELFERKRAHARMGSVLQGVALTRIHGRSTEGQPDYVPPLSPADLEAGDVVRMIDAGVKIELRALGEPTELLKSVVGGITPQEFRTVTDALFEAAMAEIPEGRQPRFVLRVQRIAEQAAQARR